MVNALEVKGLVKTYPEFTLGELSFTLPRGSIMGLIGENGAGKSTTIKLILNLLHRDAGSVQVLGRDNVADEMEVKRQLGVVLDQGTFPEGFKAGDVSRVLRHLYPDWDEAVFGQYLDRFALPRTKTVKTFSRGMKTKLSLAAALSHHASLLILDEPTAGLDPVVREELLDVLLEHIQDEGNSVLISSHLLSDLEKICDYIAFIHRGKLLFCQSKEELYDRYGMLKCSTDAFARLDKSVIVGHRKNEFGVEALVRRDRVPRELRLEPAGIEEIMLFTIRGEKE